MARDRNPAGKPPPDDTYIPTWLQPLPAPEVHEGGESMWQAWHEAAGELEAAFLPTQPSEPMPLGETRGDRPQPPAQQGPLSAEQLMVEARRHNRVCPRPAHWSRLFRDLGGASYVDLRPPPTDTWMWTKLSSLQKRLSFREYLEWAERHGKLPVVARFMENLQEADWLHMGDD